MNRIFVQHIFVFLTLISFVFFSGCGQLTTVNVPTSTASAKVSPTFTSRSADSTITPTPTVTPLPCISIPQAPRTKLEKIAETWFLSSSSQVPARSQYEFNDAEEAWHIVCSGYQRLILSNDQAAYSPMEISLRLITESVQGQYFLLDNVIVVAVSSDELMAGIGHTHPPNFSRNIATVVVRYPYTNVQFESRADYVFEDDIWQIRWRGTRWRCIDNNDPKWNTMEKINCP